ncbi:hypothetical protein KC19_1G209800 [Ceratodon purpureus]|uniref:C2 and GRAM domain-containing protein n=1 Tax=Ceratodon purpureus TaxID=3225 RepID=A0A8T0J7K4_CERPU|nr:hypothetical protein KC19_1G209800 [Ceratodon purpureus]
METVKENRVSASSVVGESVRPSLMRTDSMSSDSSIDSENLIDIPVSPSMMPYPQDLLVGSLTPDQEFEKELEKQERKRHRKKWKGDAQRVASKLSSALKKRGSRHGGSESASFSTRSSELDSFRSHDDSMSSDVSCGEEDDSIPLSFFDDDGKSVGASPEEFPPPYAGGVVMDQKYAVSAKAMNAIIFKPGSAFVKELHEIQKTTDFREEPWKKVGNEPIKRSLSSTRAATKLVKSVKSFETQTYNRADDKGFCIQLTSSTPDAPYGGNFVVEMQVVILALPDSPSGEKCCRVQVSWRLNFLHSTMMKGMIETGARNGIRDSFNVYQEVLARYATPLSERESPRSVSAASDVDEKLISDWEIAWDYFKKWHVLLALLSLIIILVHISLAAPRRKSGLEFWIINFPDSLMELLISALVVVQVERVAIMVYNFVRARYWQSGDHGVKAQGDGWLTSVTLVEGANIALPDSGAPSPYVVFTCNGKHRTSSVKMRTTNPAWREIFEFNAFEDPPSTMEVEVFDFDGPFSEAESLGRAEINFLKQSPGQLADFWVPLDGKSARANGSKLHLRVFLTHTRDTDALPEYLERVEREAGLKVRKRSAQKNSSFQKLFSLPAEEFLINDFACAIKRKIPIQGRLFLSPRLLGFYSNLFGHKTKFTLLWEEIEEIKETAQSINPSIVVFLRKGRGFDARHGARGIDGKGRLKFQFLSFVRSGTAFRAIVALWKNRNLSFEQKMDIIASVEAGDMKYSVAERQADDRQPFLGIEEAPMSEVVRMETPITVDVLHTYFTDDQKERSVNEKLGLSNYESSPWEIVDGKTGIQRRHRSYRLSRLITQFGSQISGIQQKTISIDSKKLIINEILTLHDVPFGDHFQIQTRIELETLSMQPITTQYKAFVGVAWHKATELDQRKVTKNIYEHMTNQFRSLIEIIVDEVQPPHSPAKDEKRKDDRRKDDKRSNGF